MSFPMTLLPNLLLFFLILLPPSHAQQNATASCPLDFSILRPFITNSNPPTLDVSTTCQHIRQGLRLVQSHYLQLTNSFLLPLHSSEPCLQAYQSLLAPFLPNFDIRTSCGFQTEWGSRRCMNITTKSQFEALIPNSTMEDVVSNCNQSLLNGSPCALCTQALANLLACYLPGPNVSDCTTYTLTYAAAFVNHYGPTDKVTASCLFALDFSGSSSGNKKRKVMILVVLIGVGVGLVIVIGGCWFIYRKHKHLKMKNLRDRARNLEIGTGLIRESTTLVKFGFDEIKKATKNFSRDNIIGSGGYGNVYKGVLLDGSEVALKRFKNCFAVGDANFTHEVEVIASVRHVNLVALRGYCTATTPLEGHQRIIVCDLMKNGSLHDHLFGSKEGRLSWPIRAKIALGTARGLAYLHYGAQPGIIHRDIKASNILLDEKFEAKVADFGLAKFTPEGRTHLSTRVAGTMGYVAPEYALNFYPKCCNNQCPGYNNIGVGLMIFQQFGGINGICFYASNILSQQK
ncbi:hypothetical protein SLEP1_g48631 [Rubroshorea leprosula]|uniref:Protein kinase domain-containing protein n=1 Tax=Rubroshorea leprosula TaxID=152421 RepID=A0AAV5LX96_9ROSI|nr:hypothetical protein SLEP1_g48631 [Rubroshorea leprosula]